MMKSITSGERTYEFNAVLGKGTWGEVFEVSKIGPHNVHQIVAIKVKARGRRNNVGNPLRATGKIIDHLNQFDNEQKIHLNLEHPNIVQLYHWFVDDNYTYLVLELCSRPLDQVLTRRGCLTEDEVSVLIISLLGGIKYLESKNIVHRDIKPTNILLDTRGKVKICDFGFAVHMEPDEQLYVECGALNYRAPEMLDSQGYGVAVDMWSVNVVMYKLLTGFLPFYAEEESHIRNNIRHCIYEWPEMSVSPEAKKAVSSVFVSVPRPTPEKHAKDVFFTRRPWYKQCCQDARIECPAEDEPWEDASRQSDR